MTVSEQVGSHRHQWTVTSSHPVSEGLVVYQRCACGQWRITSTPAYPIAYPELARPGH
jgi:hypothetical protein